jgi:hypothetical protein
MQGEERREGERRRFARMKEYEQVEREGNSVLPVSHVAAYRSAE